MNLIIEKVLDFTGRKVDDLDHCARLPEEGKATYTGEHFNVSLAQARQLFLEFPQQIWIKKGLGSSVDIVVPMEQVSKFKKILEGR